MAQNRGILSRVEAFLLIASCPIWCPLACCFILLDRDPHVEHVEDKLELARQKRFGVQCPTKLHPPRKRELSQPPPIQREEAAEEEPAEDEPTNIGPVDAVKEKTAKDDGVEVKLVQLASKLHLKKDRKPTATMSTQKQSMLLSKLPSEIRRMIWKEVLCDHVLNINHNWFEPPRKFEALRRRDRKPLFYGCWDYARTPNVDGGQETRFWRPRSLGAIDCDLIDKTIRLLSLPLACRQTYMECINLIYQSNYFSFRHLFQLTYLKSSILPKRMAQIRYVRLQWRFPVNAFDVDNIHRKWNRPPWDIKTWEKAMDALSCMEGLRRLLIVISGRFDDNEMSTGALLLSLARVRVPKTARYEVCVPWRENGMDRLLLHEGLPFTLLRLVDSLDGSV